MLILCVQSMQGHSALQPRQTNVLVKTFKPKKFQLNVYMSFVHQNTCSTNRQESKQNL